MVTRVANVAGSVVIVLFDDFLLLVLVGPVRRGSVRPPRQPGRPAARPRLVRIRVERHLVRARRVRHFGRVAAVVRVLGLARDGRLHEREADVRGPFVTPAGVRAVGNAGKKILDRVWWINYGRGFLIFLIIISVLTISYNFFSIRYN